MTAASQRPPDRGRAVSAKARGSGRARLSPWSAPLLILLVVVWLLWLASLGLPPTFTDFIARHVSRGALGVDAQSLRLDVIEGVVLKDVHVYRRGMIGRPLVSAPEAVLRLNPAGILTGEPLVRSLDIRGTTAVHLPAGPAPGQRAADFGFFSLKVVMEQCEIAGQWLERAAFDVHAAGRVLRIANLTAVAGRPGEPQAALSGSLDFFAASGSFRGRVDLRGAPAAVEPFFKSAHAGVAQFLEEFRAAEDPVGCEAEIEGETGEAWSFRMGVDIFGRRCAYRGVDLRAFHATGRLAFAPGSATMVLDPAVVVRSEGVMAGRLAADFTRKRIEFSAISMVEPAAAAAMLGPFAERIVQAFRAEGPVQVRGEGVASYGDPGLTDVTLDVRAERLGFGPLRADQAAFRAELKGLSCRVSDLEAACGGGSLTGSVEIAVSDRAAGGQDVRYTIRGGCRDIDLEGLLAGWGIRPGERVFGRLSGACELTGLAGEGQARTARGGGWVRIDDGHLFRVPLFGPLSRFVGRLVPGLDEALSQGEGSAEFTVRDGGIESENVKIEGDLLSVEGRGRFGLDRGLDFRVQARLRDQSIAGKTLRMVTSPVSKLLEFRLRGTVAEPRWHPENLPGDLLERLGLSRKDEALPAGP